MGLIKYFDTSSLLSISSADIFFSGDYEIYLSEISIDELENIKVSNSKTEDIKYKARNAVRMLRENKGKYKVIAESICRSKCIELNFDFINDNFILAGCLYLKDIFNSSNDTNIEFYTEDFLLELKAETNNFIVKSVFDNNNEGQYTGYKEIQLKEEEIIWLFGHINENPYKCLTNEYLIIKDEDNNTLHKLKWNGSYFCEIAEVKGLRSEVMGSIKPLDSYQSIVIDSFVNNKITMIRGKSGSGKSYLSLGFLFNQLDKKKINKIIVFCNTVPTMHSAKIGYLPGNKDEKLIDASIGNMLGSKLGGKTKIKTLIEEDKLILLPLCDLRGYDTSNMKAGIYISEAQNADIAMMKLALQRIGEDCVCIIDGDSDTQVDDISFAGRNNGMRRVSDIFKGQDIYGEVTLKQIHRSHICELADKL